MQAFDPDRPNLEQILAWNGVESFVESRDETNTPQACPVYDIFINNNNN